MGTAGSILIQTLVNLAWLPLRLLMIILGLVMVPLAVATGKTVGYDDYYQTKIRDWPYHWMAKLFSTWHSGETPTWWLKRGNETWYHMIRNPANGMKWWFEDVPQEDTILLGYGHAISPQIARREGRRFIWHYRHDGRFLGGFFCNFIWSDTHHLRFRFGFKVGSMVEGMGYTISFIPWRKG